jgi:DNA-binding response OmpR family regulator
VERVLGQDLEEETTQDEEQAPPRVLIVDDEEEARLMVRALLEREEYEVWEAENGHKAQDIIKNDPNWSLVILDLKMPGMDGREVLQFIRGSSDSVAIPVMIRTGTGTDHTEAELLEMGADDYIPKSVDPARFMARVRAVLRRSLL